VKYADKVYAMGFYWPKYACINLAGVWTVKFRVHGTRLDWKYFVPQIAYKC